jgi:hypothetical protein
LNLWSIIKIMYKYFNFHKEPASCWIKCHNTKLHVLIRIINNILKEWITNEKLRLKRDLCHRFSLNFNNSKWDKNSNIFRQTIRDQWKIILKMYKLTVRTTLDSLMCNIYVHSQLFSYEISRFFEKKFKPIDKSLSDPK